MSDGLLKACAVVDDTDLGEICLHFHISGNERSNICEETKDVADRRFRALRLWKKRREEEPKVSLLLGLFGQMNVGRYIIQKKYEELCPRM